MFGTWAVFQVLSLSPAMLALLSRFSLPYWGQCSQQQQKSLAFLGDLFVQHVFCLSIPSNVKVCVKERGEVPVLSSGVDSWWLQCALASPGLQRAGIADSAQITYVHPFQNGQCCFEKEGSIYAHAWIETCKANGLQPRSIVTRCVFFATTLTQGWMDGERPRCCGWPVQSPGCDYLLMLRCVLCQPLLSSPFLR